MGGTNKEKTFWGSSLLNLCVLVIQKMYMKSLMGNGELSIIIYYHLNDLIIVE